MRSLRVKSVLALLGFRFFTRPAVPGHAYRYLIESRRNLYTPLKANSKTPAPPNFTVQA